ncbi:glycerophosphodiester phosphodiesterase [Chloroflexota bacterium]
MLDHWPNPLVIAHRGASKYAPENTIAAFKLAKKVNADGIEFDVKLTADRQVVVIHDSTVDRTTNGSGKVSDMPLAEIKELDAGSKFKGSFSEEKIPTLREMFELFGDQLRMNVELTNYTSPLDGLMYEVFKLIKEFNLQESIIFSSFLPTNLKLAGKLLPEIPRGLLTFPGWIGKTSRLLTKRSSYQALHPHFNDVNERLITNVHSQGKRIHVWTVNEEDRIKEFINLGVDGLITDDPELVQSIVGRI